MVFIMACIIIIYLTLLFLRLKEYLGSGRFGVVYRGLLTVTGADSEGGIKEVAVKTMENGASEEDRVKFLQEAGISWDSLITSTLSESLEFLHPTTNQQVGIS